MNAFDIVSHIFAVLPVFTALRAGLYHLSSFIMLAVFVSIWYHVDVSNDIMRHLDHFFSSALIIITFMLYMDQVYRPTYIAVCLLFAVVILDYTMHIAIVQFYVGIAVFAAVSMFLYERRTVTVQPKRLQTDDPYFISFIVTQFIAIAFFLWDKDPYAHSLWHLFAFTSLASVIGHLHEDNEDAKRKQFYLLGSIPSRLFIAAILMHWRDIVYPSNMPVALGAALMGLGMLFKTKRGLSYIILGAILLVRIERNGIIAGVWLAVDTLVSLWTWSRRKEEPQQTEFKKIQLENLRF